MGSMVLLAWARMVQGAGSRTLPVLRADGDGMTDEKSPFSRVRLVSGGAVWVNEPVSPRSFRVDGAKLSLHRRGEADPQSTVYSSQVFDQEPLNMESEMYTALALDAGGLLVKSNRVFTPEEMEGLAPLACIHHLDHRTITAVVEGGSVTTAANSAPPLVGPPPACPDCGARTEGATTYRFCFDCFFEGVVDRRMVPK